MSSKESIKNSSIATESQSYEALRRDLETIINDISLCEEDILRDGIHRTTGIDPNRVNKYDKNIGAKFPATIEQILELFRINNFDISKIRNMGSVGLSQYLNMQINPDAQLLKIVQTTKELHIITYPRLSKELGLI